MWFGGQGRDGHDRIHLASSSDGTSWAQRGVVLEDPSANHVNDPSVVEVNGKLFMYYTRAATGVSDEIAVATSVDGIQWHRQGTALKPGPAGSWDSFAVGRPAVIFEEGRFRMWYDGRKDLPPDAPDSDAPKSSTSQRYVGYATSTDGVRWEKHGSNPVYDHDAGGIHVVRFDGSLLMLIESRSGTLCARSRDGLLWDGLQELVPRDDEPRERFGHVTPFLLFDSDRRGATLFYGGAAAASWNQNAIRSRRLSDAQWKMLNAARPGSQAPPPIADGSTH